MQHARARSAATELRAAVVKAEIRRGQRDEPVRKAQTPFPATCWEGCSPSRPSPVRGLSMSPKKALHDREKELQSLLATPAGRKELQDLDSRYHSASGRLKPPSTPIITSILVNKHAP